MPNITLFLPDDVYEDMKKFSEVKWSEVARKSIIAKVEALKLAEKLAKKDKISPEDIKEFASKMNLISDSAKKKKNEGK
jgi:predicted HTH transcriptional regulator